MDACTWSASSRLHTSNSHIRELQGRIAELEGARPQDEDVGSTVKHDRPRTRAVTDSLEYASSIGPSHHALEDSSPIYTVIGPTERGPSKEGFFGSTSAGTFMQNVSLVVEQRLNGSATPSISFLSAPDNVHCARSVRISTSSDQTATIDKAQICLPLRKTADELLQVYWQLHHPTFPILDREEVQIDYERLWTDVDDIRDLRSFLCLINAMFALSSQLNPSTSPSDRARIAAPYFNRAQDLLDVFQKGCLRSAQTLLLLCMYCQSSSNAHQCWAFMGLAIRACQSLGLHVAHTSEREPDGRRREMLRRVWHGCVMLDQIVSSVSGRPCGKSNDAQQRISSGATTTRFWLEHC